MNPFTRWKFDRALDSAYAKWVLNRQLWEMWRQVERANANGGPIDTTQLVSGMSE